MRPDWRIAVSIRRIEAWTEWVHRSVWVIKIGICHDAIVEAAADVAIVRGVVVVGFIVPESHG